MGQKKFLGDRPPRLSQGLGDHLSPPPPPSQGLDLALPFVTKITTMALFDPLRSSKTNLLYLGTGCPEGWDEFGSLCYFHVNKGKMTMGQGQDECQLLGATLPVIKSAEEKDFLLNLMEENGEPWLGVEASDSDNDFKWVDETSVVSNFSA